MAGHWTLQLSHRRFIHLSIISITETQDQIRGAPHEETGLIQAIFLAFYSKYNRVDRPVGNSCGQFLPSGQKQNNKENKEGSPDTSSSDAVNKLLDVDFTTAGVVRLPVCDPERAFQSWDTTDKGSSTLYPYDIPPGLSECSDSSFEDQTSGAWPKVEDCRQIITNIQGDGSTKWTTQVVGKNQREIASAGSCHFGVEATKVNGNVNFAFGGQDAIDIINDAIEQFGNSDGLVGAKGDLQCNGNIKQQAVKWGIY